MNQTTDILIVGAGPTGLALALELSLHNVSFRIIDKEPTRSDKSRALGVQPRSLELLRRHGDIADRIAERATAGTGAKFYTGRGKHTADIRFDDLDIADTEFPLPLFISQAETERILEWRLKEGGHVVDRPLAAEGVEQDGDGVTVLLRDKDGGSSTLRCKYVVGCDGSHSAIRRSAKLDFAGESYDHQLILCDAQLTGDYSPHRFSIFFGRRLLALFPLQDGLVRLVGVRRLDNNDKDTSIEEFRELLTERAPEGWDVHDPIWLTSFRFHRRGVNNYRSGRLFVAGDAAHIHSPLGGQGMNTGIQDAINLGWKLAFVLQGKREEGFLDSYDAERRPVGDHLLQGTDKAFTFMTRPNPVIWHIVNILAPYLVPIVTRFRSLRLRLFRFVSELGVRYRRSPEVATANGFRGLVKGGDRAPDGKVENEHGEVRFLLQLCSALDYTLLLFSGCDGTVTDWKILDSVEEKVTEREAFRKVRVVRINGEGVEFQHGWRDAGNFLHGKYGLSTGGGLLLIRPDSYVAFAGSYSSVGELQAWAR